MRMWIAILLFSAAAMAATPPPAKEKGKNKKHDFDAQTVEGEVYRPDYSVVTGDAPGEGWGVLRLRPNFEDHRVSDFEESKALSQGKKR